MSINTDLLADTLAACEMDAEHWDQRFWAKEQTGCGTTMCFAGMAVTLQGYRLIEDKKLRGVHYWGDTVLHGYEECSKDGKTEWIRDVAIRELGLTEGQAVQLFAASNSHDDVRRIVAELKEAG